MTFYYDTILLTMTHHFDKQHYIDIVKMTVKMTQSRQWQNHIDHCDSNGANLRWFCLGVDHQPPDHDIMTVTMASTYKQWQWQYYIDSMTTMMTTYGESLSWGRPSASRPWWRQWWGWSGEWPHRFRRSSEPWPPCRHHPAKESTRLSHIYTKYISGVNIIPTKSICHSGIQSNMVTVSMLITVYCLQRILPSFIKMSYKLTGYNKFKIARPYCASL